MKIVVEISCMRRRCELCHLYSRVALTGEFDDGSQLGITTARRWHCSAYPGPLESDTDGRPLRSAECIASEVTRGCRDVA
jgi:hypothetical protein